MADYNLIDRITAIKLELEYETENIYSILIAIRNILHHSDGMSYLQIKNILLQYFNLYPNSQVNYYVINLITNPLTANNNSIISMLLNFYEENNSQSEELESLDSDSDYNDQNNTSNSTFNNNYYNDPLFNPINLNESNLDSIFYGPQNYQFNNYFESNISNNFNSMLTLSNFLGQGINYYGINNNNVLNLFNQMFNNVPLNQNYQDIPIVITDESFDKLKKCKYIELQQDIKSSNKKCMISLDEFQNDDDIIVLPCNHVFKIYEITNWLKCNSYKCPICRNPCGNYYAKIS